MQAYPRQIDLVGLKRVDDCTCGNFRRPASRVKPRGHAQGSDGVSKGRRAPLESETELRMRFRKLCVPVVIIDVDLWLN